MDDWLIAQTDCAACDGLGTWPWLGECFLCEGTGVVEYEGPDEQRVATAA